MGAYQSPADLGRVISDLQRRVSTVERTTTLRGTVVSVVRKAADETVTNSITLQDDNELFFSAKPDQTWFVEAFLFLSTTAGGAAADFKFGWDGPSGLGAIWGAVGDAAAIIPGAMWGAVGTTATPSNARSEAQTLSVGSRNDDNFHGVILAGRFSVAGGGEAGNIQLQWAQDTATAVDSTILGDSFLRLTRLR